MNTSVDSATDIVAKISEQVNADYKQIQGLVHQRNVFHKTIKSCQEVCARYLLPNSEPAQKFMSELLGILDDKNLIEEMQK